MEIKLYEPPTASGFLELYRIPRLGALTIATIANQSFGWGSSVHVKKVGPKQMRKFLDADVVGLSVLTNSAPSGYTFARDLRELANRLGRKPPLLMIGGVHVSAFPDEPFKHGFDIVVRGEAEETLEELLPAIQRRGSLSGIRGVSYKQGSVLTHNAPRGLPTNLNIFPTPDWSLMSGWQPIRYYPTYVARGCLYDCSFCTVWTFNGNFMRIRDPKLVVEEIRSVEAPFIFFYDDAFDLANLKKSREMGLSVLQEMKRQGIRKPWGAQVTEHSFEDEEFLDLCKATGCRVVYIGVESINPEAIGQYGKNQNKRALVPRLMENIRKYTSRGIHVHGMFICGADADNSETLRYQAEVASNKLELTTFHTSILMPLPGAVDREEFLVPVVKDEQISPPHRILFPDRWDWYEGLHAVIRHPKMSSLELLNSAYDSWRIFYENRGSWKKILARMINPLFWVYLMVVILRLLAIPAVGLWGYMKKDYRVLLRYRQKTWTYIGKSTGSAWIEITYKLIWRMIQDWWNHPDMVAHRAELSQIPFAELKMDDVEKWRKSGREQKIVQIKREQKALAAAEKT